MFDMLNNDLPNLLMVLNVCVMVTEPKQAMQDPSKQRLSCVCVSPSGRYMAIGGDDEILKVALVKLQPRQYTK